MGWNVPDDWGSYYYNCDCCGSRYHASEGGCGCMDDLECQCGLGRWDGHENSRCNNCGTGHRVDGRRHSSEHVARKYHSAKPGQEQIRPGDKYRRTVQFAHYPNGAFTLSVTKHLLEKGPHWPVAEVMEN